MMENIYKQRYSIDEDEAKRVSDEYGIPGECDEDFAPDCAKEPITEKEVGDNYPEINELAEIAITESDYLDSDKEEDLTEQELTKKELWAKIKYLDNEIVLLKADIESFERQLDNASTNRNDDLAEYVKGLLLSSEDRLEKLKTERKQTISSLEDLEND